MYNITLKKINSGVLLMCPYEDLHIDDFELFVEWLDDHFPDAYEIDHMYLFVKPEAETFLALTFPFV